MAKNHKNWRTCLVPVFLAVPLTAFATFPDLDPPARHHNAGPGIANHPIGIKPTSAVRIPSDWQLAGDGTLTCTTCHYAPATGKDRHLRGGAKDDGKAFCMNCHADSESGMAMHWQAIAKAHITAQDNRDQSSRLSTDGSRTCLACHDGVSATDAGHNAMPGSGGLSDRSSNHPVGVRYPFAGMKRAEVPLRPATTVPATVSLAGGVVSCTSCHNLYASDPQRLSVPIEGSQLCFACHDLN